MTILAQTREWWFTYTLIHTVTHSLTKLHWWGKKQVNSKEGKRGAWEYEGDEDVEYRLQNSELWQGTFRATLEVQVWPFSLKDGDGQTDICGDKGGTLPHICCLIIIFIITAFKKSLLCFSVEIYPAATVCTLFRKQERHSPFCFPCWQNPVRTLQQLLFCCCEKTFWRKET